MTKAKSWTKFEVNYIKKEYNSEPGRIHEIATALGRTYDSIATKANRLGIKGGITRVRHLGVNPNEYEDLEELWGAIQHVQKYAQKLDNEVTNPVVNFSHIDHPILLWFLADAHVGAMNAEYDALEKRVEYLATINHGYGISVGDTTDNFLPSRIPQGMFKQIIPPSLQRQLIEHQFIKLQGKWLAVVEGNHENRSADVDDFHFSSQLARRLHCYNMGHGGLLTLKLGEQSYEIAMRHKFNKNSYMNPTHAPMQMRRLNYPSADIAIVAHNHQAAITEVHEPTKNRVYIRPGSFKGPDSYSRSVGFIETPHCIPSVILYPEKRMMLPFLNLDAAVTTFESII